MTPRAAAAASSAVSVPVTDASSRYIDAPDRPFGRLEHVALALELARAHRAAARRGASRSCGAPGSRRPAAPAARGRAGRAAGRAAAPSRAAARPARLCGSSRSTVAHRMRSVLVPMPSTSRAEIDEQARHHLDVADARHVGEHALLVGEQARRDERQRRVLVAADDDAPGQRPAAFDEQCGHRTSSSCHARGPRGPAQRRPARAAYHSEQANLLAQASRRSGPHLVAAARRSARRMSAAVAPPSLTMKLACTGDTRAPPIAVPFSPARSMSAPADGGIPSGTRSTAGSGFWKTQPGARQVERLRALAVRQRPPRRLAQAPPGRRRRQREERRQHDLAGPLQPAAIVARTPSRAPARRTIAPSAADDDGPSPPGRRSIARRSARCRRRRRRPCPACPPTPRARPGRGRSSSEPGRSSSTPASARTPDSPSSTDRAAAHPNDDAADPRVADEHVRPAAEDASTATPACARQRAAPPPVSSTSPHLDQAVGRPADPERRERRQRHVAAARARRRTVHEPVKRQRIVTSHCCDSCRGVSRRSC